MPGLNSYDGVTGQSKPCVAHNGSAVQVDGINRRCKDEIAHANRSRKFRNGSGVKRRSCSPSVIRLVSCFESSWHLAKMDDDVRQSSLRDHSYRLNFDKDIWAGKPGYG